MSELKKRWAIAFLYVASIYATLSIVPIPLFYLRSHNMLRITIASLFLLCLAVILVFMLFRTRNPWRFLAVFCLAAVYGALTTRVKIPEEQIHFIQYGLVGVLFARAVAVRWTDGWRTFFVALSLAVVAGTLDELLQGHIPNRHYDVHDIWLDAVSALLGLFVYRLIPAVPVEAGRMG
jgi:VanZ family protein